MSGTIPALRSLEESIGRDLDAVKGSQPGTLTNVRDVRDQVVAFHKNLRRISQFQRPQDHVFQAILRAHQDGGKMPALADTDATAFESFLRSRYGIIKSDDPMEARQWQSILILIAQQAIMARTILSNSKKDDMAIESSDRQIQFTQLTGTPKNNEKFREDIAESLYLSHLTSMRKLQGLPPLAFTPDTIVKHLRSMGSKLFVGTTDGFKDPVATLACSEKSTDRDWPDDIQVGSKKISIPILSFTGRKKLEIEEFVTASTPSLLSFVPLRTITYLLARFPTHIPFVNCKWIYQKE